MWTMRALRVDRPPSRFPLVEELGIGPLSWLKTSAELGATEIGDDVGINVGLCRAGPCSDGRLPIAGSHCYLRNWPTLVLAGAV